MRFFQRLPSISLLALGALLSSGCEIIAQIDRSEIDSSGGGEGGGGKGGAGQGGSGQAGGGQGGGGQGGGGQGGMGGGGGPVGCVIIEDCPAASGPCEVAACSNGVCGYTPVADMTPIANQTLGDCKTIVCDMGMPVSQDDDFDIFDDGAECTIEYCMAGSPQVILVGFGAPCTQNGGALCDGNGVCAPTMCGDAAITGNEVCDDGNTDDNDGCDSNCTPTGCGNGVATAGEECDDGNMVDDDGCTSTCLLAGCGNGVIEAMEMCDDGNLIEGDGCDSNCTPTACGNGALSFDEVCDDANSMDGDGCSATCQVEADYQCTIEPVPNVCTRAETDCSDGMDNDGDGMADLNDSDCALGNEILPCNAGEALYILHSVDVPKNIPDEEARLSRIVATREALVKRAVVKLSITHPLDADVNIALTSPASTYIALSSGNGGTGSNYMNTIFDDACMTPITAGMAPFTGCFGPQDPLLMVVDESSNGQWLLEVGDDAVGNVGSIQSWSLALCVAPLP